MESNKDKDLFPSHLYENKDMQESGMVTIQSEQEVEKSLLANKKVNIGESTTEESYERMPIDDFGKSVLQKLGWKEEKPIGKSFKEGEVYVPPKFDKLIPR